MKGWVPERTVSAYFPSRFQIQTLSSLPPVSSVIMVDAQQARVLYDYPHLPAHLLARWLLHCPGPLALCIHCSLPCTPFPTLSGPTQWPGHFWTVLLSMSPQVPGLVTSQGPPALWPLVIGDLIYRPSGPCPFRARQSALPIVRLDKRAS